MTTNPRCAREIYILFINEPVMMIVIIHHVHSRRGWFLLCKYPMPPSMAKRWKKEESRWPDRNYSSQWSCRQQQSNTRPSILNHIVHNGCRDLKSPPNDRHRDAFSLLVSDRARYCRYLFDLAISRRRWLEGSIVKIWSVALCIIM